MPPAQAEKEEDNSGTNAESRQQPQAFRRWKVQVADAELEVVEIFKPKQKYSAMDSIG